MTGPLTRTRGESIAHAPLAQVPSKKRNSHQAQVDQEPYSKVLLTPKFIKEQEETFKKSEKFQMVRNTISTVGVEFLITDTDALKKVDRLFPVSAKPDKYKATNQMQSGRCWLFAGLNVFRPLVCKAFKIPNFEFSQSYLFFCNKLECVDRRLQEMVQLKNTPLNNYLADGPAYDDYLERILEQPIEDGGHWNYFCNLVEKYGLLPLTEMPETVNSRYSVDLNKELASLIRQGAQYFRTPGLNSNQIETKRLEIMQRATEVLGKFLGIPPSKFDWTFTSKALAEEDDDGGDSKPVCIKDLTPLKFKEMVLGKINLLEDFVVLSNCPLKEWPYFRRYEVKQDVNMVGGKTHQFINVPMDVIERYLKFSLAAGMPVWFAGDIQREYNPFVSVLSSNVVKTELAFGSAIVAQDKEARFRYKDSVGCHAMTFIGMKLDDKGSIASLQVENSHGADGEEPGEDGFLSADWKWAQDNVFEVVILKNLIVGDDDRLIARQVKRCLDSEPIQLKTLGVAACKHH
jgi:bleomycin hydrolase